MSNRTVAVLALTIAATASLYAQTASPKPQEKPTPSAHPAAKDAGRHGQFTRKAAEGPHMQVLSATHFGTSGHETFVDVAQLADGTIAAFGRSWGPNWPDKLPTQTLGKGKHGGTVKTTPDRSGVQRPDQKAADLAGFIVLYQVAAGQLKPTRALRFDWGVADISAATISGDQTAFIIAGRCLQHFNTVADNARNTTRVAQTKPAPPQRTSRRNQTPANAPPPSDVYVARMQPDGQIDWMVLLEQNNDPPTRLFTDSKANVYFDARGLHRVSPDGKQVAIINTRSGSGTTSWLGVDPKTGDVFFGGDRNTHTGHQPWRQPFVYRFDQAGNRNLTLWEFDPKECACGPGGNGLCSDSSPKTMAFDLNGDWLFAGWSDGGNTVFSRQATDWRTPAGSQGMGMNAAGVGVSSLAHMMRVDPKSHQTKAYTFWSSYIPMYFSAEKFRGKPNGASIDHLTVLPSGAVAIAGGAATGLIQTPNAFWFDPGLPDRHGGAFVAVFRPDLSNLLFSSYTPGVADLRIAPLKNGLAVVGTSTGSDRWVRPTASPSIKPAQPYAGATDAWICVLLNPAP